MWQSRQRWIASVGFYICGVFTAPGSARTDAARRQNLFDRLPAIDTRNVHSLAVAAPRQGPTPCARGV